jgi:FkbM family methyltransferase
LRVNAYRKFEDWIVPADEREKTLRRVLADSAHLDLVIPRCPRRRVAVQAGAYIGIWPKKLASHFEAVYSFEPDPTSFACFTWNTRLLSNIIRLQAAVGFERDLVDLVRAPTMAARSYAGAPGIIPTLLIDDLNLPVCDLIYLDIEGREFPGLMGALHTIKRCRPIVVIEEQSRRKEVGLGERWFNEEPGLARKLMADHGYREPEEIGRVDLLFVPE